MSRSRATHRSNHRRRGARCACATLAGLLVVLTGCQGPGALFEPLDSPPRWPAPPAAPRIGYVGTIENEKDLKPGRSFGEGLGETIFGKKPSRSMLTPHGLCVDGRDRLFVADSNAQVVHVFDLQKRRYEQWRPEEDTDGAEGTGGFSQPVAVAWDPAGRLLVSDPVAGAIFAFDDRGRSLGPMGSQFLLRPCGLVVDPVTRRIFVADTGTHQVVVLAVDGGLLQRIGSRGSEPGRFNFPTNVALDAAGRLYVSDSLNFRVQVFGRDLALVGQVGSQGDRPGYFSRPKGVALDSADHLYVVDANFEAVQVFDADGRLLLSFGEEGRGPGQFWLPNGIHVDDRDRIWVADSYNRRVQVFEYIPEPEP
ncbi:MAG: 6-bladed beta-propeller [Planctomycetes bacterium]|nr:6-bladed beta-propeller [Planctomycetota bacterium]